MGKLSASMARWFRGPAAGARQQRASTRDDGVATAGARAGPESPRAQEEARPRDGPPAGAVAAAARDDFGPASPAAAQHAEHAEQAHDCCAICLRSLEPGEPASVVFRKCRHLFHSECIGPWLKLAGTCPCCRDVVTEEQKAPAAESPAAQRAASSSSALSNTITAPSLRVESLRVDEIRAPSIRSEEIP